jgi:hypothetical protein
MNLKDNTSRSLTPNGDKVDDLAALLKPIQKQGGLT